MKQEQHFHPDMFKIFVGYNNIITVAGVNVMLCISTQRNISIYSRTQSAI